MILRLLASVLVRLGRARGEVIGIISVKRTAADTSRVLEGELSHLRETMTEALR